jgi:hypothetical protein
LSLSAGQRYAGTGRGILRSTRNKRERDTGAKTIFATQRDVAEAYVLIMEGELATSIGWAAGIGGFYGGAVYGTYLLAQRFQGAIFLGVMLGGMLARMVLLLVAVGGVLALLPVRIGVFAALLAAVLIAGLTLDVVLMQRRLRRSSDESSSSATPVSTTSV